MKDIDITVPLKQLGNSEEPPEMSLINCETIFIFTCLSTCVIIDSTDAGRFEITD